VGPDLTGIGQRQSPAELLESILLPSKRITEGYASTDLELTSDESITGFIEREDDQTIVIRPVTAADTPLSIPKRKIAQRRLSQLSNMPAGIVNSLTQEQILDLLAYLISPLAN
jgi:putative heme-binding domain-containing protein